MGDDAIRALARNIGLVPEVSGHANVQDAIAAGGTPAGVAVVHRFPIAFNTPGILTGATLYTPAVGDILIDAWFSITTAWDGTTPKGDIGGFVSENIGAFAEGVTGAVNMANVDKSDGSDMPNTWATGEGANVLSLAVPTAFGGNKRLMPIMFTTVDPVKVCVSQDGTNNGSDPGSTHGVGAVYLIVATPA